MQLKHKKSYVIRPPKAALQKWVDDNRISISSFASTVGYTYAYAWQVVRGHGEVTFDLIARLVLAYGAQAVEPILLAFKPNGVVDWPLMMTWTKRQMQE